MKCVHKYMLSVVDIHIKHEYLQHVIRLCCSSLFLAVVYHPAQAEERQEDNVGFYKLLQRLV